MTLIEEEGLDGNSFLLCLHWCFPEQHFFNNTINSSTSYETTQYNETSGSKSVLIWTNTCKKKLTKNYSIPEDSLEVSNDRTNSIILRATYTMIRFITWYMPHLCLQGLLYCQIHSPIYQYLKDITHIIINLMICFKLWQSYLFRLK